MTSFIPCVIISLSFSLDVETALSEQDTASLLKGYTTVFRNPATTFSGVIAFSQAFRRIPAC